MNMELLKLYCQISQEEIKNECEETWLHHQEFMDQLSDEESKVFCSLMVDYLEFSEKTLIQTKNKYRQYQNDRIRNTALKNLPVKLGLSDEAIEAIKKIKFDPDKMKADMERERNLYFANMIPKHPWLKQ